MFSNLIVDKPIETLIGDWDLLEDTVAKKFSTFRQEGQSIYGIRRRQVSAEGVVDIKKGGLSDRFSLGPSGFVTSHKQELVLHVITSGTPHHSPHNFGFWHINDKDELYLQMRGNSEDELGYSLTIMGTPKDSDTDRVAWYCQTCETMIFERMLRTGQVGFHHFWKWEEASVREFNSNVQNRTCPECGDIHPLGYMWNPAKDTPEEREARMAW
jgi:hypothetical protein